MKGIILFDIDLALFNTDLFRLSYPAKMIKAIGISPKEFQASRSQYLDRLEKSTDFLPTRYLKHLAKSYGVSNKKLARIYFQKSNFQKSLYPETKRVLKKLVRNYELGIYSEGFKNCQMRKLEKSEIKKYFSQRRIFIFRRKTKPEMIGQLPKGAVIVDDRLTVIKELRKYRDLKPIWLNRKRDEGNYKWQIENLNELEKNLLILEGKGSDSRI